MENITVEMDKELKEAVKKLAKKSRLTMAAYVRLLLLEKVNSNGRNKV